MEFLLWKSWLKLQHLLLQSRFERNIKNPNKQKIFYLHFLIARKKSFTKEQSLEILSFTN